MKLKVILASVALSLAGAILLCGFAMPVSATMKYTKQTGKACSYCHDGPPAEGKLTPQGECFKKNKSLDGCQ